MGLRSDYQQSQLKLSGAKLSPLKMKKLFLAFLLDAGLYSYSGLIFYKIIVQKMMLGERYAEFSWSEPLMALAFGSLFAVAMLSTKISIGKYSQSMVALRPDKASLKQAIPLLGLFHLGMTFIAGLSITQVSVREFLSESGLMGAKRIFTAILNPNWQIFDIALFAAIETIYMAFIATAFALPFAFLLGFVAARNLMNQSPVMLAIYSVVRFFLNVTRSIEPLVWAIIFSVWVGIGPFAGMLALCLHSISSLTKLYSEQIENINEGPIEAMKATGAHPIQIVWFGVVPQIVLPYLSYTIYRWDINVRMATVIGLVGGGGIGTLLMQYQGLAKWNEVGLLVIIIASIVWVMDYASSKIRESLK
jgi:phosphonate transport system permease protein